MNLAEIRKKALQAKLEKTEQVPFAAITAPVEQESFAQDIPPAKLPTEAPARKEIDLDRELEAAMLASADVPSHSPLLRKETSVISMDELLQDGPGELLAEVAEQPAALCQSVPIPAKPSPGVEMIPPVYSSPPLQTAAPVTVPNNVAAAPPEMPAAPVVQQVQPSQKSFDPLAILLAGRENSGSTQYDEYAESDEFSRIIDEDIEEYLCFRVATESYAINIMSIKEIIKPREVTEVPRMPEFVTGILSLRGVIIPNIDMRLRLGLPRVKQGTKERVIVVKNRDEISGILVDEVIQVVRLHRQTIEQPPAILEGIDRDFVKGIGRINDRMLILLNLESILDLSLT